MQPTDELMTDQTATEVTPGEASADWLDPVTGDVLTQVMTELASMASLLGRATARRRIGEIQGLARTLLHQVAKLVMGQEINPWVRLRMTPDDPPFPRPLSAVRVGVYPLSANPIHWGHLLSGLDVMVKARLDKVLYLICQDPSTPAELYPEELRRAAAAEAIALFQPLFALVPEQTTRSSGGPASFFRLLELNAGQMAEAFYISGHDGGAMSAGEPGTPDAGNPRILMVPFPLPWVSTSMVRPALLSSQHRDDLAALPACAFRHLRMLSSFD